MRKQIGLFGLGKMGGGLALNLKEHGWEVIGYNRTPDVTKEYEDQGVVGAYSYQELVQKLEAPRLIWTMVTHKAVDSILNKLLPLIDKGDTVIEGGNSFYKDSIKRRQKAQEYGINFLDCGVSGGPGGARYGACCMVGGPKEVFENYEGLFKDISVKNGYGYFGETGAGHFVKMVHNGIEYGMMQAIGEGFNVMKESSYNLNLTKVAEVYNHGSVIESRLSGWLKSAYEQYGEDLDEISGSVKHSGEGLWMVETAKEMGVPVKIIEDALSFRIDSEKKPTYTGQVVSALRNQFGGHEVKKVN